MSKEAFVLQPGEGRSIDLGGFLMSVKASAESTGGAWLKTNSNSAAGGR